ncbi:MAG: DUF4153 domain-containing protein [Saprospiraceae bacterium]
MKLPSPGFLLQAFLSAVIRFPAAMLSAFAGVMAMQVIINDYNTPDEWVRTILVALIGVPFFTALIAFAESRDWSESRKWLVQVLGILALIAYGFVLDPTGSGFEYKQLPGYLALVLIGHLFVAVAPYLNNLSVRDFWEYNKILFANIVIGACFTFILNSGLSLAILAVDQLFDLKIDFKVYPRLAIFLAGIFNTAYFLYHFPNSFQFEQKENTIAVVFKNLCKYILIPIVGLYFLILYTYSLKILISWDLPRGWVSSLVIGFSVAGIFTYLLNFYLPELEKAKIIHLFKKWFWWILLPMTLLLFVAIGRRISDYGITEFRFLVAETGVWLALVCLYFIISKTDNIKFIPISLGLFALAYAFGPLSARSVSLRNQVGRLTESLKESGRFENGKMKPGTAAMSEASIEQFSASLTYLDYRKSLDVLDEFLPAPIDSLPIDTPKEFDWKTERLRTWLNISDSTYTADRNYYFNISSYSRNKPIDIAGYNSFVKADTYERKDKSGENGLLISEDGQHFVRYVITDAGEVTDTIDLKPIISKWMELRNENYYLELKGENQLDTIKIRSGNMLMVTENCSIHIDKDGSKITSWNGYLFMK